jgi:vacuolar-type H+-ATPase subunit E/Vma4
MKNKITKHPKKPIDVNQNLLAKINITIYDNQFVIEYINSDKITNVMVNNAFESIMNDFYNEKTKKITKFLT